MFSDFSQSYEKITLPKAGFLASPFKRTLTFTPNKQVETKYPLSIRPTRIRPSPA